MRAVQICSPAPHIVVVDDDPTIHDVLGTALRPYGFYVIGFADGDAFLAEAGNCQAGCVLLDVNMPGRSGLDVLKALDAQRYPAPILMISANDDIPIVVEAMRNGALDYVQKPFDIETMVARVRQTLAVSRRFATSHAGPAQRSQAFNVLTHREQEVLAEIVKGLSNKEVGRTLNISTRTAEVHRARIMDKLMARNTADLMRIVLTRDVAHASLAQDG